MGSGRRLRLMLLSLAAALGVVAGLAWLADPYGAWGHGVIDPRYRSVAAAPCARDMHERVTTPYRLRVERPRRVLLGSSRMLCGVPVGAGSSHGVMNASLPGATIPELAAVARAAAANPELEEMVLAVDFYAFSAQVQESQDAQIFARLDGAAGLALLDAARTVKENLLTLEALTESWLVLWRRAGDRATGAPAQPVPWPEAAIAAGVAAPARGLDQTPDAVVKRQIADIVGIHWQYRFSPEVAARLRDAIVFVREGGVNVTVVVFPSNLCELEVVRSLGLWEAYLEWKRALLRVAGPYWDFSGYNAGAGRPELFTDSLHLRPAAGHALLRRVLGEPCTGCGDAARALYDAGVWVDTATIDAHLASTSPDAATPDVRDPRCARLVAEVFGADPALAAITP